jgi:hypothetical protein
VCRTLADTGAGQMAMGMLHGKQFLEPQFQVGGVILRRRLDLSLKTSDLSVFLMALEVFLGVCQPDLGDGEWQEPGAVIPQKNRADLFSQDPV